MTDPRHKVSSRPPPEIFPRGTNVGRYVIIDVLGQGGMGVVYAAYDTQLDRKLAIKLLRPEFLLGEDVAEIEARLLREAQAMARLTHPNVVSVFDVGLHDGHVFLAMEFIEGTTLKEWLMAPRPLKERLRKMCDAGRGLAAAHAGGLVHRDFKPDNILVAKDGRVVVLDFGLARADSDTTPETPLPMLPGGAEAASHRSDSSLSAPLTMTGSVLGTVGYMAPEQAFGEAANAATDQFSFAATLYTALYGEKPFPDPSIPGYLDQVEKPPKEPKGGKDVPSWMRRVVLRGLSPDPKERYPSLDAMLFALTHDPTLLGRQIAAVGVILAVVALLFGAVVHSVRARGNVCAPNPAAFEGTWNPRVRAAIAKSFEASGVDGAKAGAATVAKRIDAFASQWVAMRAEVCRATRLDKQQSEEVFRLRNDCLDREQVQMKSLTRLLESADSEVVKRAVDVAYGLPETSWCADVTTLRASAGLPDDPTKRSAVLSVRAKLADSDAKALAGKSKEALELAKEAVEIARPIGHDATTAEALYSEGATLQTLGEFVTAVPLLREAFMTATAAGDDSLVVTAARTLAFVTGPKLQKADESRNWLDTSRATLARMGGNEELDLQLMITQSSILNEVDWRPDLSILVEEKAVAAARRIYGEHPKTENALYNAGVSWFYMGEPTRARPFFEESLALSLRLGSPTDVSVGTDMYMLGATKTEIGEMKEGDIALRRAIEIFAQHDADYWAAIAYQALTLSQLWQGDTKGAVSSAENSLKMFVKAKQPKVLLPIVNVPAASAFIRAGRFEDAFTLCEAALAEETRSNSLAPEKAYGWDALRCKAEALITMKKSALAIPLLERSLTLTKRMFPGDYSRTEFALAKAFDAAHAEPARALLLARKAKEGLSRFPFLTCERDEVDSWLRGHGAGN